MMQRILRSNPNVRIISSLKFDLVIRDDDQFQVGASFLKKSTNFSRMLQLCGVRVCVAVSFVFALHKTRFFTAKVTNFRQLNWASSTREGNK